MEIVPYGPEDLEGVLDLLSETAPSGGFKPLQRETWKRLFQSPDPSNTLLVARIAGRPAGLLVASRLGQTSRYLEIRVAAEFRRRGVATCLCNTLIGGLAGGPRPVQLILQFDESHGEQGLNAFAQSAGFTRLPDSLQMEFMGQLPPPPNTAPIKIRRCDPADASSSHEIAALHNWGFRGDPTVPARTAEDVRNSLANSQCQIEIAELGAKVVGYSEWTPVADSAGLFISEVVARPHWGSGLSDALGIETMHRMRQAGCQRILASISASNAASVSLSKRLGMRQTALSIRYALAVT